MSTKTGYNIPIFMIKRWVQNRINNYGRNETLNALQEQIKVWEGKDG